MGQFGTGVDPLGAFNLKPMPTKSALAENYLDFTSQAGNDFSQQYLPELYEMEVERYGNRTLSGFLRMVGAEMPMTSDQVVWSEQNRLHIGYETSGAAGTAESVTVTTAADGLVTLGSGHNMAIREGNTVVIEGVTGTGAGQTIKAYVSAIDPLAPGASNPRQFTVLPYTQATLATSTLFADNDTINIFVYGSEFAKGQLGMNGSLEASFQQYSNKPIIIKDTYEISGSDAAQIGWVEVAAEDGTNGYLWYLKSEGRNKITFPRLLRDGCC